MYMYEKKSKFVFFKRNTAIHRRNTKCCLFPSFIISKSTTPTRHKSFFITGYVRG